MTTRIEEEEYGDSPTRSSSNNKNNNNKIFLFDFDGVVCDSCDECTVSAWRTCLQLGVIKQATSAAVDQVKAENDTSSSSSTQQLTTITTQPEATKFPPPPPAWLFPIMRKIRPAIEVGWQIPVLLSVVFDEAKTKNKNNITASHSSKRNDDDDNDEAALLLDLDLDDFLQSILDNYESIVSDWLEKWRLTPKDMIQTFGNVRDDWMKNDLDSWLEINTFYQGVPQALNDCQSKAFLVTTKQQRFAIALCRHANVTPLALPDDCIFGLGQYENKMNVIYDQMQKQQQKQIMSRGDGNNLDTFAAAAAVNYSLYFFEDRWPTLEKCLKDERLGQVQFHLCAWGYVTPQELALAQAEPRVHVVDLEDFQRIVCCRHND